jgi:hypothetical protein
VPDFPKPKPYQVDSKRKGEVFERALDSLACIRLVIGSLHGARGQDLGRFTDADQSCVPYSPTDCFFMPPLPAKDSPGGDMSHVQGPNTCNPAMSWGFNHVSLTVEGSHVLLCPWIIFCYAATRLHVSLTVEGSHVLLCPWIIFCYAATRLHVSLTVEGSHVLLRPWIIFCYAATEATCCCALLINDVQRSQ